MNDTDESTAVFNIRKNFNDFYSAMSGSSLASKLDFEGGGEESFSKHIDAISAHGHLSELRLKLDSAETSRKRARIEHERDMENARKEQQRDRDKISELKQQLVKLAKKEELCRQELVEFKKSTEMSTASSAERLKATQREKLELETTLDKLRQSSQEKVSQLKMSKLRLKQLLHDREQELAETKQSLDLARRETSDCRRLQLDLAEAQTALAQSKQQAKDLELELSRAEEAVKVGSALKSQLSRLSQLEADNKKLTEDNLYLSSKGIPVRWNPNDASAEVSRLSDMVLQQRRFYAKTTDDVGQAVQQNGLVLNEECESLRQKLSRAEERSVALSALEVECEELKRRLSEWEAVECRGLGGGLRTPTQLARTLADLQCTNELLLEKNGSLQARVHSLSATLETSEQRVRKLESDFAAESGKRQEMAETVKRVGRKLLLVSKERDGYKSMIDSYESELTMSVSARSDGQLRQSLEEVISGLRKSDAALNSDLEKALSQVSEYKTRIILLEQQLNEARMASSDTAAAGSHSTDDGIAVQLRERIAELEEKLEKVSAENENLSDQLERRAMQGDYDPKRTKVLQYSMNPFSTAQRRLTAELDRLQEENRRLTKRLQIMEESRGAAVDDLSARVDSEMLHATDGKEFEEVKAQLVSAELKNKRLIEQFKKTSQELREVSYQLLGFRIDIPNTGQYRLMNMYAESPNDYFLFKQSTGGELQMLANKYSELFGDQIETYLHGADSIPAFLSSVTLQLFQRQTIMQGRTL